MKNNLSFYDGGCGSIIPFCGAVKLREGNNKRLQTVSLFAMRKLGVK